MTGPAADATPWYHRGACVGSNPDVFFLDRKAAREKALEFCAECFVLLECREYALTLPQQGEGIWGGTTQARRRRIHRNRMAIISRRRR